MRNCTRCNIEMIEHKRLIAEPDIHNGNIKGVAVKIKRERAKNFSEKLNRIINMDTESYVYETECKVVVCPECGMVEHYVSSEDIKEIQSILN